MPRRTVGFGLAGTALVVSLVGLWQRPTAFWAAYLTAVVFWLSVSLGCLGTALLHSLTGGRWGEAVGRELRAGLAPLAVGLLAVVPLAFGASAIYPGAASEGETVLNAHQRTYFTPVMIGGRIALYAVVWGGLSAWLLWAHNRYREHYASAVGQRKAALGLLAFWLTVTFASVDGLMSLTPGWASSMFPLMAVVGTGIAGLAFVVVVRGLTLSRDNPTERQRRDMHDLGNMLQAYNMMWTYLAFSQYLITWSGDIADEVQWYFDRRNPVTNVVAVALFLLHFVVPFLLLLSRDLKRNPRKLAAVAGLLLVMRLLADAWIVLPPTGADAAWGAALVVCNVVVIGAAWLSVFFATRRRLPELAPAGDASASEPSSQQSAEGAL